MLKALRRRIVKLITRFHDPITTLKIGQFTIEIPMSHALRDITQSFTQYNVNLARIAKHVSNKYSATTIIDIGANIGDTVAFIKNEVDVPILCIDGEDGFVKLLLKNTAKFSNVSVCKTLVGPENKRISAKLKKGNGTAYLEDGATLTEMRTLDNILEEYPKFGISKLIKTDTDGFDTIILRSCEQYLHRISPVLFFEFDPHLIARNNDDAFEFVKFLENCGYRYFVFYTNIGEYLVSCSSNDKEILNGLIHFFSGRKLDLFADVCALTEADRDLYLKISEGEISHFRKIRNY